MIRKFRFVKYQGCGNDFLVRDELSGPRTSDADRGTMARKLLDRHFGVGADGILFIETGEDVDGSMRLFEPDGKEADMCGNGIRCVASYLMSKLGRDEVRILTKDGVKRVTKIGGDYRVDMGVVRSTRSHLSAYITDEGEAEDSMLTMEIRTEGHALPASMVNSGEPHIVVRSSDVAAERVSDIGASVNRHRERFPKGVNLDFVQVTGPHSITIRTYERGVYAETMACGTGATASAAVALALKWVDEGEVSVKTRGGEMKIAIDENGRAMMTGPALRVFSGETNVDL